MKTMVIEVSPGQEYEMALAIYADEGAVEEALIDGIMQKFALISVSLEDSRVVVEGNIPSSTRQRIRERIED